MSRNGTMSSNVSQQQQQHNMQQLQSLEATYNTYQQQKSITSDKRLMTDASQQSQSSPQQRPGVHSRALSGHVSGHETAQLDPRNPLAVAIPISSNPTEVLATRFAAWRAIIASLLQYLGEVVSIQDEVVRQQIRLSHAVNFDVFANRAGTQPRSSNNSSHQQKEEQLPQTFFVQPGNGSVQDLPQLLINFHASAAALAQKSSKELSTNVIPRLEDLRRELLVKIKEIKGLSSDFKSNIMKDLMTTKQDLQVYLKSVEDARFNTNSIQPKNDPYLTKIILDKQIKRQIVEENYLHEAFINLQSSGKELEKVVVSEVQNALVVFARLLGEQAQNVFDRLITNLDYGFLTKPPSFEWDQFVAKDKNFIDENLPKRDYNSITYEKDNDPLTLEIRASFLERRSKFLKSYSKGYYVLTPTFFHEFKSADRKKDLSPVMSLSLDDIELEEHSKFESNQHKFVLKKVGKLSSHKFIFKAESYEAMLSWYNDIKNLKSMNNAAARGVYAAKHHTAKQPLSRVSSVQSQVPVKSSLTNESTHDFDTVLTMPNSNQVLPMTHSSLVPQNLDGIYMKHVTMEQAPQRHSITSNTYVPLGKYLNQQQQQGPAPQQYQGQQLQFQQAQQFQNAPYPVQKPFADSTGQYGAAPQVYVEPPTAVNGIGGDRRSLVSNEVQNDTNNNNIESPDQSGFSEEGKTAKKETHTA